MNGLWVVLLLFSSSTWAAEDDATLIRQPKPRIERLSFRSEPVEIQSERQGNQIRFSALVKGLYSDDDYSLLVTAEFNSSVEVDRDEKGNFQVLIPLKKSRTKVTFATVSEAGELGSEDIEIVVPKWDELTSSSGKKLKKRYALAAGVSYTVLSYEQSASAVSQLKQTALTTKVVYNYFLVPGKWDLGLSAYFTALPLGSTVSGVNIRFLGVNLRAGYQLYGVKSSWSLSLLGGFYYVTTFVPGKVLGFENIGGPQIFPVLQKTLGSRSSAQMYFKFSPITNRFVNPLSLSNREIALGGAYSYLLKNGHPLSATIDYANFKIHFDDVLVRFNTISLGLAYGF